MHRDRNLLFRLLWTAQYPNFCVYLKTPLSWVVLGLMTASVGDVLQWDQCRPMNIRCMKFDIALYLDHSFAVELYVAWTVLRARHANLNGPEGHWVTKASSYTNCLSYVLPLEYSNQQRTPLIHRLLMDCRAMSTSFTAPGHIHPQPSGTIMDGILDAVDASTKRCAHRQRPRCGWICQPDEP